MIFTLMHLIVISDISKFTIIAILLTIYHISSNFIIFLNFNLT